MILASDEILVLRDVCADMTSRGGFRWPESGVVECDDWEATDRCGHGLHGLPWGVGGDYRIGATDAKWLVVRVSTDPDNYRSGVGELTDKCKFRRGDVVFCGSREDAVAYVVERAPVNTPINWASQTAGHRSTQTAGYRSTQTAGDESTQKAGDASTQKAGEGTVQVVCFWDGGKWHTKHRLIGPGGADKWYRFEDGDWRLCTDAECEAAERKVAG